MAIFCHVFGVTTIRLILPLKNDPHMALLSRNLNWPNIRRAYMHPRAIDHDEAKVGGCSTLSATVSPDVVCKKAAQYSGQRRLLSVRLNLVGGLG